MPDLFAPPGSDLQKIGVAAFPTPGQGVALDQDGRFPGIIRQTLAGYQIDYVQITGDVTVSSTSESSPTLIVSGNPIYFDGRTDIEVIFSATSVSAPAAAGGATLVSLWDGSTNLGRIAMVFTPAAAETRCPVYMPQRITPTQGYHTYKFQGFTVSGAGNNGTVFAGSGGSGSHRPAFIRIVRAD